MKAAKIIKDYGVILDDEEYEKRQVRYNSDMYIECFLDDGIICLVPSYKWVTLIEMEGVINGN
jgi:hypothetical protein